MTWGGHGIDWITREADAQEIWFESLAQDISSAFVS